MPLKIWRLSNVFTFEHFNVQEAFEPSIGSMKVDEGYLKPSASTPIRKSGDLWAVVDRLFKGFNGSKLSDSSPSFEVCIRLHPVLTCLLEYMHPYILNKGSQIVIDVCFAIPWYVIFQRAVILTACHEGVHIFRTVCSMNASSSRTNDGSDCFRESTVDCFRHCLVIIVTVYLYEKLKLWIHTYIQDQNVNDEIDRLRGSTKRCSGLLTSSQSHKMTGGHEQSFFLNLSDRCWNMLRMAKSFSCSLLNTLPQTLMSPSGEISVCMYIHGEISQTKCFPISSRNLCVKYSLYIYIHINFQLSGHALYDLNDITADT